MDSRQRFKDIILLLKHSRKAQVIGGVIIFFVVWSFIGSNPQRRMPVRTVQEVDVGTGSADGLSTYRDLITRFERDVRELKEENVEDKEALQEIGDRLAQYDNRTAEILRKLIERISDIEANQASAVQQLPPPQNITGEAFEDVAPDTLEAFGEVKEEEVLPAVIPQRERIAVIGAGDSVRIKLLAGVNAPTDGTPYPVVFKLASDVDGPDGSALPLGEARLIAAAQGSLSDQRALFRLTSLNIRYPDGSRNIIPVDGWVVGEDGIRGMEGIMVDPIAKALAGSVLSGTVQGAGRGVASSHQQTVITQDGQVLSSLDGDILEYALARGLAKGGQRWSKFIDERSGQLVPHIKVLSGREATAVFSKSVQIDGLYDSIDEESYAFASLD